MRKDGDSGARADAGKHLPTGGLAVTAGDAIAPPPRPRPAPWWAPASDTERRVRGRGERAPLGFVPLAAVAVVFLILPLVALLVRAPWGSLPGDLTAPGVLTALRLSLVCSLGALCLSLVFGVPLAWLLARVPFPGRNVVRALVLLPMVLPPVVGGVALLLAFGRNGIAGQWLDSLFGVTLPFSTLGAMLAETFVAMPFLVITVEAGIRAMDRRYEDAAATLGAGRWLIFRRVTLPLIAPALAAGSALSWARALGEFGATITFAGNMPGRTQTMPLAVYLALQNNAGAAITLSLVMLAISLAVLVGLRGQWFPRR
ncbi:MAG: molybdate ABC transporter permease subunit [Actinobacteria bacterium]|nr:molybdate ABC transporter permease subunit [Actinomycetota bacterium]